MTASKFPTALVTLSDLLGEFPNFPEQTLSGAHNNSVTTITLTAAVPASWPTVGDVTIDSEIIHYTGKPGSTLTGCTRGVQSTTAASHSDQAKVGLYLTAATVNQILVEIIAVETKIGTTSSTPTSGAVLTGTGAGTSEWDTTPAIGTISGTLVIQGASLSVGTSPATAGHLRLPNGSTGSVSFLNAAGSANISALGTDTSNNLYLGAMNANTIQVMGGTVVIGSSYVAIGSGVSATGGLRLPNGFTGAVKSRTNAGSGDFYLIYGSTDDTVFLGDRAILVVGANLTNGALPAGAAGRDGGLAVDSTNNRFVFYSGGNRYYIAGTAF